MKLKSSLVLVTVLAIVGMQTACAQQVQITKKQFNTHSFSAIDTDIVGNIIFTQSDGTSVSAEGNKEFVDALEIGVEDGTLKIDTKNTFKRNRKNVKLSLYISSPEIDKIKSDGVGNITLKGNIKTAELKIDSDGVGNITATNLTCENVIVDSDGVGNITLAGKTDYLKIDSDGVGNVNAEELEATRATVSSNGVGNVKFFASQSMDVRANGIGNVIYYGNPKEKVKIKNGLGRIKSGK